MSEYVGKYALIAYNGEICLPELKLIVSEHDGNMVKMESGQYYYKTAILKLYDDPKDAEYVLKLHEKYMETRKKHDIIEKEMHITIIGIIKHF